MDIVKAYEIIKINKSKDKVKENDELLNISISRFEKGIASHIIVHKDEDLKYCVIKLIEAGFTDVMIEQNEDNYRFYSEEKKEDLIIEGEYIIG